MPCIQCSFFFCSYISVSMYFCYSTIYFYFLLSFFRGQYDMSHMSYMYIVKIVFFAKQKAKWKLLLFAKTRKAKSKIGIDLKCMSWCVQDTSKWNQRLTCKCKTRDEYNSIGTKPFHFHSGGWRQIVRYIPFFTVN